MADDDWPCSCWQQVSLHDGHCCFGYPDHDYSPDVPLPCGHDEREATDA